MDNNLLKDAALHYHAKGRPGKIEVIPTKETANQRDLSLAYSPGVAEPCLSIARNPSDVYRYTAKGNLVAVISNGTAVLGLGDIGAAAGKPVMEGKGLLFKIYADIDCFDLELDTKNVDEFVRTVKILEPTFGGINLEDISAPECFEIEDQRRGLVECVGVGRQGYFQSQNRGQRRGRLCHFLYPHLRFPGRGQAQCIHV